MKSTKSCSLIGRTESFYLSRRGSSPCMASRILKIQSCSSTEEQEATNLQIGVRIPAWLQNKNGSVERNW